MNAYHHKGLQSRGPQSGDTVLGRRALGRLEDQWGSRIRRDCHPCVRLQVLMPRSLGRNKVWGLSGSHQFLCFLCFFKITWII